MTDPNSPPSSASAGAARAPFTHDAGRARPRRAALWLVFLLVLLVAAAAAVGGFALDRKVNRVNEAALARTQGTERQLMEAQVRATQATEALQRLQAQVSANDGRLADAQAQQQALEHLYQDLTRNRDDWTLAETEELLSAASQQLQLTGNVKLALFALQSVDQRLAASSAPRMVAVRKALAEDIDKLKTTPPLDLAGLAVKLDTAVSEVDAMPLAADARADRPTAAAPGTAANATNATSATAATAGASDAQPAASGTQSAAALRLAEFRGWWRRVFSAAGDELRGLVQVRRVENADALLIAPDQAYFLRANLKLRLMSARLSVLARNHATLASDLKVARTEIDRYFDAAAPSTQRVRALLDEVSHGAAEVALPTLSASLEAVHQYRSGK